MKTLNVYGFGVQLQADIDVGNQGGRNYAVISSTAESARAALAAEIGDDLVKVNGPTLIVEGAILDEAASAPVLPICTTIPYASGTGAVGDVVSCTSGTWSGEPTSYAYQWKNENGDDLGTGADYTVLAGDAGHSLTCIVTASNAAGSVAAPPSNAVGVAVAARSHHRK